MNVTIREIVATEDFSEYYASLPKNVQAKYDYAIQIIATQKVVSIKFVKRLEKTDLYELRVSVGTNEHRTIMLAVDKANFIECTKVVLLNSFLKKSTKQYKAEIKKASDILKKLEEQV